jgi:hypothetical protein
MAVVGNAVAAIRLLASSLATLAGKLVSRLPVVIMLAGTLHLQLFANPVAPSIVQVRLVSVVEHDGHPKAVVPPVLNATDTFVAPLNVPLFATPVLAPVHDPKVMSKSGTTHLFTAVVFAVAASTLRPASVLFKLTALPDIVVLAGRAAAVIVPRSATV